MLEVDFGAWYRSALGGRCCDTQANDGMYEPDLRSATSPRYGLISSFARSTVAFGVA
jgi:hypothetical protein